MQLATVTRVLVQLHVDLSGHLKAISDPPKIYLGTYNHYIIINRKRMRVDVPTSVINVLTVAVRCDYHESYHYKKRCLTTYVDYII